MNRTTILAELKESNINQLVANDMLMIRGGTYCASPKKSRSKKKKSGGKKSKKNNGWYCGCGW